MNADGVFLLGGVHVDSNRAFLQQMFDERDAWADGGRLQDLIATVLATDMPSYDFHDSTLYADAVFLVLECLARILFAASHSAAMQQQQIAPLFRKCLPLLLVQRREADALADSFREHKTPQEEQQRFAASEGEREAELRDACGAVLWTFVLLASREDQAGAGGNSSAYFDMLACLLACRGLCGDGAPLVVVPVAVSARPSAHEHLLSLRRMSRRHAAAMSSAPDNRGPDMVADADADADGTELGAVQGLSLLTPCLRDCASSAVAATKGLWDSDSVASKDLAAHIDGLLERLVDDASPEALAAQSIALARVFASHVRDPVSRDRSSFASRDADSLCCLLFGHAAMRMLRGSPSYLNSAAASTLLPLLLQLLATYSPDERRLAAALAYTVVTRCTATVLTSCQSLLLPPLLRAFDVCDEPSAAFLLARAAHAYLAAVTVVNTGAHGSLAPSGSTETHACAHRLLALHLDKCQRNPDRLAASLLALVLALPSMPVVLMGLYSRSIVDIAAAALNCFSLPAQLAALSLVRAMLHGGAGHVRPFVLPLLVEMVRVFVYYTARLKERPERAGVGSGAAASMGLPDFSGADADARGMLVAALTDTCRALRAACGKEWVESAAVVLRAAERGGGTEGGGLVCAIGKLIKDVDVVTK